MPSVMDMARELEMNAKIDGMRSPPPASSTSEKSLSSEEPEHMKENTSWRLRSAPCHVGDSPGSSASDDSLTAAAPATERFSSPSRRPPLPAPAMRCESDMHAMRMRSGIGGRPTDRPKPFTRQVSQASQLSADTSEGKRMSSFSRHIRFSRKDSHDSILSAASEPVSYSQHLYVSSDIWLTEKKLDEVEDDIVFREQEKQKKRAAQRHSASHAFSPVAEGQNISSKLVGLLWSSPVASGAPASTRSRRGNHRGGYRVRERGTLGPDGHKKTYDGGVAREMGMKSMHAATDGPSDCMAGEPSGRQGGAQYMKRFMRKADVGRWLRRRSHRRAERREPW